MNIFKQFYRSIYSPKDISIFRFQGIGKTILYVFFLTLISILPSLFFISTAISSGIDTAKSIVSNELPSFSIKNGQLHANTSVPITINKDNFTVYLDPTGVLTEKKLAGTDTGFAFLQKEFVLVAGGKTEVYPYSMLNEVNLTNRDFIHFFDALNGIKVIMIPVISLFIYLFSSASSFIEVSILALFGLALKNMTGRKINYRQLWRMAAYSETLPTLFFTVMSALKTTVPNGFLINWFVAIVVLLLAINEIPKPKKKQV